MQKKIVIATLIFVGMCTNIYASSSIEDDFTFGPEESMRSYLDRLSPTSTNAYSDYVRIKVSGYGQSSGSAVSDTFWQFNPSLERYIGLYLSFTGDARRGEADGKTIVGYIRYYSDTGWVDGYPQKEYSGHDGDVPIPDYNPLHDYDFIIDVGNDPQHLSLGTGDGGWYDNTGFFDIRISQATVVTPEPVSCILFTVGGLGLLMGKKMKKINI